MSDRIDALMDAMKPALANPDLHLPTTEPRGSELTHRDDPVLPGRDPRGGGINSGLVAGF
jgi:hypothetical protein